MSHLGTPDYSVSKNMAREYDILASKCSLMETGTHSIPMKYPMYRFIPILVRVNVYTGTGTVMETGTHGIPMKYPNCHRPVR
jgi:hypothetical protein